MGTAGPFVLLLFLSSMEVSLSQRTKATSLGDGGCQRARTLFIYFIFLKCHRSDQRVPPVFETGACHARGGLVVSALAMEQWMQASGGFRP